MKKITLFLIIFLSGCLPVLSLTADDILKLVDKNMTFETERGRAVMVIDRDGRKITKEFIVYGAREGNKFYAEYLNQEDKGVKYLKLEKELWIYLPDADDILKISGHMLRQGMMGSDISYEDILNDEEYTKKYSAALSEETIIDNIKCYNIELTAKSDDATYYRQKMAIDKVRLIPLEITLYAKSGRELKKMKLANIKSIGKRYFATVISFVDLRKNNSITTIEYKEIEFDIAVPKNFFSKQILKR